YAVGLGGDCLDCAAAAAYVAHRARPGDGIIYQARQDNESWLMIGYGLRYYMSRDVPNGQPALRELLIARTAAEAGTLYPVPCRHPAACLGAEPRIWIVGGAREKSPDEAVTPAQATPLPPLYPLRHPHPLPPL